MPKLNILLVDNDPDRSAVVRQALQEVGYHVIANLGDDVNLSKNVFSLQPDIIIIDMDAPGRDTLEQMREIQRGQAKPIILFSAPDDQHFMQEAIRAGVSAYMLEGLNQSQIMPVIEVAMARFREFQTLQKELEDTRSKLAERKVIEKAKGIIMTRKGLDEESAYQMMRKMAMSQNKRLVDLSQAIVSLEDLLG
ncbi:MAG: ANTAR domain-containing protein [Methylovulum sp.]|nr:ANTAR domain-containing protein [Methylovulum sp.]